MAEHQRVESQEPLLQPGRRHLRNFVVVEDKGLKLSELGENAWRDAPHPVARGIQHLKISQGTHSVQAFAREFVPGGSEIRDLSQR